MKQLYLIALVAMVFASNQPTYAGASNDAAILKELLANRRKNAALRIHMPFSNLSNVDLSSLDLKNVNLRGADLSGANLSGSDLRGARLEKATITGADLRDANLSNTNLEEVKGLKSTQVRGALFIGTYGLNDDDRLWLSRNKAIQ